MDLIKKIEEQIAMGRGIVTEYAVELGSLDPRDVFLLFPLTGRLRRELSGNKVFLCSIVNGKSGRCSEDCRFCAQSARHQTGVETYPFIGREAVMKVAASAQKGKAREFSIVTSGKGVSEPGEVQAIAESIAAVAALGLKPCASPGLVSDEVIKKWKDAGLVHFHHNLECARSFFGTVCTTHDYDEDIAAVKRAKAAGLHVCAGGIFGMGESWAQRVELIEELRALEVDSVPLNFLDPIPGTPMAETAPGISPLEALKTIALVRLMMPRVKIVLCGGRPKNLRDLQAVAFEAGANAMMIGNYLTTKGRPVDDDLRMLADLGLEPAPP